jgi:hypothetical protein
MKFGEALECLKDDFKVARHGWNGKNMWLTLVQGNGSTYMDYECISFIAMKTVDNKIVPWLASQTDILAEDWVLIAND